MDIPCIFNASSTDGPLCSKLKNQDKVDELSKNHFLKYILNRNSSITQLQLILMNIYMKPDLIMRKDELLA